MKIRKKKKLKKKSEEKMERERDELLNKFILKNRFIFILSRGRNVEL